MMMGFDDSDKGGSPMMHNRKKIKNTAPSAKDEPSRRPWTEYIFTLFVGSTYIYALNRVIVSSTFIQPEQSRLFIMGLVSLVLFAVIFYNIYTRVITGVLVAIVAIYVFFTIERWERQIYHLNNVRMMVQGYQPYQTELGLTVLWVISLLIGLVVAVFMLYKFSFYILSLTGVAIFLFTWGPGFTRDAPSFLLFLVCFCLILVRKTNNGLAAVYIAAPICAALVWFVHGTVPEEAEIFQRRSLQELFDGPLSTISDFIYTLTNPMYFTFHSTGFSGHGGRLGGPIAPNSRNVMTVQAPGRTYLAGITHNIYTGYRWYSSLEHGDLYTQGMHQSRFEMLETTAALIRSAAHTDERASIPISLLWNIFPLYDQHRLSVRDFATLGLGGYHVNQYLHTYMPIDQATIAIGSNRTGTIFRAQNTRQLWFHAAGPDYLPDLVFYPSGDVRAPGFMARGTQYSMNFLNVNPRLTFIHDMLNRSHSGLYAERSPQSLAFHNGSVAISTLDIDVTASDMNEIFEQFAHQGPARELNYMTTFEELIDKLDAFSRDVLSRYAETVREHFMYVPEITPQRVHDKVAEITYDLESDFEKIMAIRYYLIQFPYTLSPQSVPDGVCFVDHFLFDGQEGYCTYYATAMAVMSRIAGVPSRYVEGFLLPPAEEHPALFAVTNMMAHAWVEVYFEGFGWLIVEATAPYAFFQDPELIPPPGFFNPDFHMTDWIDMWDIDFPNFNENSGLDLGDFVRPEASVVAEGRNLPTLTQVRTYVFIGLGALVLLALGFFFVRYLQVVLKVRRVRKLDTNKQIAAYFNGIVDITSHVAKPMDPEETPYAYGQKVGRRFAFKSDRVLLKDLVDLYYKARYGSRELTQKERDLMADSYFDMVGHMRNENQRVSYIYMRYVRQVGAV